jgi:hypothetical protein
MKNKFKTWKTIKLGTYKNADELCNALRGSGISTINKTVENVIQRDPEFIIASEKEIKLINISVAEIGFPNGANYGDILSKAEELGLSLCPSEVGPQLHLQYKDQPKSELLRIAMEPVWYFFNPSAGCGWVIFIVDGSNDPRWVCYHVMCRDCREDEFVEATVRFVFTING